MLELQGLPLLCRFALSRLLLLPWRALGRLDYWMNGTLDERLLTERESVSLLPLRIKTRLFDCLMALCPEYWEAA